MVFIKDDKSEMAVLFSYAAHPVSVHSTSTEFTADYPGYAARYIQSRYPGSIAVFLQGCGANPIQLLEEVMKLQKVMASNLVRQY